MRNVIKIGMVLILSCIWNVNTLFCQTPYEQNALNYFIAKKDSFILKNTKTCIKDSISKVDTDLSYFPGLNLDATKTTKIVSKTSTLLVPKKYRYKQGCGEYVWYIDKAIKNDKNIYVLARLQKVKKTNGGTTVLFKLSDKGEVIEYYKSNWIE